ncbi:MAG: sodium-translocating pyrophosphatase [Actinobacteria bacterium]|nr:sodium-translocating pyrophosphatase [Actinomycetota bacterium]
MRELPLVWWVAPIGAVVALLMALYFYKSVMREAEGSDEMKRIALAVREGAYAYLRQQYKVVAIFFIVVSGLLAFMAFGLHVQHTLVPFAFLTGGFFSGLAGFIGMKTATQASARTANGAKQSLNRGLTIAFRAGAVMGLTVVGLGLLDICGWFYFLHEVWGQKMVATFGWEPMTLEQITVVMLCFGMGASSQALFARVGGGIFTKAADVGADLVGKVEAGIPEDDPRNPATIADNVGDNVGDVAGMGADLYESYCGSILATAALGVAATFGMKGDMAESAKLNMLLAPLILAGLGIIASVIGVFVVRTREDANMKMLMGALNRGIFLASALVIPATAFVIHYLQLNWAFFGSVLAGLVSGVIIGKATEYYTSPSFKPTQKLADQALTGPATVIISGIATGMISTWIPILAVSAAMITAFALPGGFHDITMGLYGISIAAVGMLSTLGITLATDAYGPIADNAGGNAEMSKQPPEVRKRTDALDALGNTTAATGKGFAIGSAALTALALLAAYVEEVRIGMHREATTAYVCTAGSEGTIHNIGYGKFAQYSTPGATTRQQQMMSTTAYIQAPGESDNTVVREAPAGITKGIFDVGGKKVLYLIPVSIGETAKAKLADVGDFQAGMLDFMRHYGATPMNPNFLVGVFLGMLLVFVFCALTMMAVGRAAGQMIEEVRRQFRTIAGIMEGTAKPDYASCVAIATSGAQRAMVFPSLLAIITPVAVGLMLNVGGVLGLLVGGLTGGFAVAVFMANAGGAWDNAKKYIEEGHLGGKGSDPHKAAVVGDTVGDPFKDTSGPSLNILIKLMSMVSVVFAGLIVKYGPVISNYLSIGWDHLAK